MPRKPRALIQCEHFQWRLFQRDGVYYADGRSKAMDLGKHSLATRNEAEALKRLVQLDRRKAIECGKITVQEVVKQSVEPLTISQGWDKYLAFSSRDRVMRGASANTIKRYRAVRDNHTAFCVRCGVETWEQFDKEQLEKYGNLRGRKRAERTVYLELTTLKSVSKWLVEEKLLPADCLLRYPLSKPQGTDTYCYRPEEVIAMVDLCMATEGLQWLGDLITVLAHTGLRISEAAGLRWTDVDLVAGVIKVADERSSVRKKRMGSARTTKGRRSRAIPIHPHLHALLVRLTRRSDGRVLHAVRGGKLLPRNVLDTFISQVIEPLKEKYPTPAGETGFEHGRIHSFRHFFCSQSFLCGASEGEVREWLGHADSKMVEHYRHLRSADALRRMARITFLPAEAECPSDDAGSHSALCRTDSDSSTGESPDADGKGIRRNEGNDQGASKSENAEIVCPSVCPSDWDKQKRLSVSGDLVATYGKRKKQKRGGQDSQMAFPERYCLYHFRQQCALRGKCLGRGRNCHERSGILTNSQTD